MKTLLDEIEEGNTRMFAFAVVVSGVALGLGVVKVKNELEMTKAYERQASALERIAAKTQGMSFSHVVFKQQEAIDLRKKILPRCVDTGMLRGMVRTQVTDEEIGCRQSAR